MFGGVKKKPRTRQICRAREIILFKSPSVGDLNQLELKYRGKFAALSSRAHTAAHTREGSRGGERGRAANAPRKRKPPASGLQGVWGYFNCWQVGVSNQKASSILGKGMFSLRSGSCKNS